MGLMIPVEVWELMGLGLEKVDPREPAAQGLRAEARINPRRPTGQIQSPALRLAREADPQPNNPATSR
jgi:hypothetical protein